MEVTEQKEPDKNFVKAVNGKSLFAKGNQIAKGVKNPIAATVNELKQAWLSAITPERMNEVAERHFDLIQSKNEKVAVAALALLYDRVYGKAKETVEMTVDTTHTSLNAPLDAADLEALERMRRKIIVVDADSTDPS